MIGEQEINFLKRNKHVYLKREKIKLQISKLIYMQLFSFIYFLIFFPSLRHTHPPLAMAKV